MKRILSAILLSVLFTGAVMAQGQPAQVKTVVDAEVSFNKAVAKKGIKDGFLSVIDEEAVVFRPNAVSAKEFYTRIEKQPGMLSWEPKFARISANGDLAFTAGPYIYQNSAADTNKVYGHYVSVWRTDASGQLKLLIDLGIQHPEPESPEIIDMKDPTGKVLPPAKDPFQAKRLILGTDDTFNHSLAISTLAGYKEFLSPEAHYYFPGFEPLIGTDKIMKFVNNNGISILSKTTSVGRSASNDLAYSYGTAIIKKGGLTNNYNYVRIWELDATHKWNIMLEVFSAVEK
jgi:ketosteroid isomerase-like protein